MSDEGRIKIGLAEDNVEFCRVLQEFLKPINEIQVVGMAHDGLSALKMVEEKPMDVLLLDLVLPNMDGLAVLEKIKNMPNKPRVIILSAFGNEAMTRRAVDLGADYFIVKPFNLEILVQRIKEIAGWGRKKPTGYTRDDVELEKQVSELLQKLHILPHLNGYAYLRAAIILCIKEPSTINAVTKNLYPRIAEQFNTTRQCVERAIRFAIETAWNRGNVEDLHQLMGYAVDQKKGKPTNISFIAKIADKIQLERKMSFRN